MKHNRQHKPDSLVYLFVLVTLGMLLTSIAQADDFLFGKTSEWHGVVSENDPVSNDFQSRVLPSAKRAWLYLPGTGGMQTALNGGMAHFLFESSSESESSSVLPANTRVIFSFGLEEEEESSIGYQTGTLEWYDRYQPTMYFTVGHRW